MKLRLKTLAISTITSFALLLGVASPAFAVENGKGTGQALEISPPLVTVSADPGETINTKILVRDISAIDLVVSNEINDFTSDGETGAPKIILDKKDVEASPYSLRDWIAPIPTKRLKSKEIVEVPVTITVPASASPGSYFAVVRFTGAASQQEGTSVGLTSSVGALVFVRVSGEAKEKLTVSDLYTGYDGKKKGLFESTPVDITVQLKNEGNVVEQPTGLATVTDMFGNEIAKLPVNSTKNYVLPGSTRSFSVTIDKSIVGKNRILFGRYTAKVNLEYSDGKKLSDTLSFWIIPYKLILLAVAVLVGLVIAFRVWMQGYKKRVVSQARRRRR